MLGVELTDKKPEQYLPFDRAQDNYLTCQPLYQLADQETSV